jgi:hypothetical protein
MSNGFFYPIADAEELVSKFLNCTLPKYDWTHEAHLVVGLYMVTHHTDQALIKMREALLKYNVSIGGVNSDTAGYHETLTIFWLERIAKICTANDGTLMWDQETLDYMLFHRDLTNRNVWLNYYPETIIQSLEARKQYMPPVFEA